MLKLPQSLFIALQRQLFSYILATVRKIVTSLCILVMPTDRLIKKTRWGYLLKRAALKERNSAQRVANRLLFRCFLKNAKDVN